MKRKIKIWRLVFWVLLVLGVFLLLKVSYNKRREEILKQEEEALREDEYRNRAKAEFAIVMRFDNNFVLATGVPVFMGVWAETSRKGIKTVLVYSEEEATGYPDDVIVAWPSLWTRGTIKELNEYINEGFDLTRYALTYPLTLESLVDNWWAVYHLLMDLDFYEVRSEYRVAHRYEREYMRNWSRQWFLVPGRIETLNEYLEGEDLSEFDLIWPITENDVWADPLYIRKVVETLPSAEQNSIEGVGKAYLREVKEE